MIRITVPLADGFEEIEAVTTIDILRRAGIEVVTAGVGVDRATGSHGIVVGCDTRLESCPVDGAPLALPGGLPGARNLAASGHLMEMIRATDRAAGLLGAICAAPTVLNAAGVLRGRRATSHPNHAGEMTDCTYVEDPVVVDGHVVTSRGAGTSVVFAAELVRYLTGEDDARRILRQIQFA